MNVIRMLRARSQEAQPLDHRLEARPCVTCSPSSGDRRDRRQPQQRVDRGQERDRVDRVGERVAAARRSRARRAAARAVKPRLNDAMLSALAAGSSSRSISRGTIADRVGWLTAKKPDCDGDDRVQEPDRLQPHAECDDQEQRHRPQTARRHQGELAPVHRVGERAAVQAERDQRHQREQADQADRERRAGDRIDLDRDRHRGHLLAELGDRVAGPEPAIVRRLLQRVGCRSTPEEGLGARRHSGMAPAVDERRGTESNLLMRHGVATYGVRTHERRWSDRCVPNGLVRWLAARRSAAHSDGVANPHLATRARGCWTSPSGHGNVPCQPAGLPCLGPGTSIG